LLAVSPEEEASTPSAAESPAEVQLRAILTILPIADETGLQFALRNLETAQWTRHTFLFRCFELHRFEYIAIPAELEIGRFRPRPKLLAMSN
jgi:hypothetical protein